jgi:hypothetical protein
MPCKWTWILASAFSLNAQVTAVLNRFPARSPEVEIRNQSTAKLTAFVVALSPVAASPEAEPFLFFADGLIEADRLPPHCELPLSFNRSCSVPVPSARNQGRPAPLFGAPVVQAALFADGTTAGDAALAARLLSRRVTMLQAVELARETLIDAGSRNVPRNQLIRQFTTLAESAGRWYLPLEQRVGRSLYESIGARLRDLPPSPLGSPFPPVAFVEEQSAALTRQRAALLDSLDR